MVHTHLANLSGTPNIHDFYVISSTLKTYLLRHWVCCCWIIADFLQWFTCDLTCVAFRGPTVPAVLALESFVNHNILPFSLNCRRILPSPSYSCVQEFNSLEIEEGWNSETAKEREHKEIMLWYLTVWEKMRDKNKVRLTYESWHQHPSGQYPLLALLHILAILSFHRRLAQRLIWQGSLSILARSIFTNAHFAGAPEHNAQMVCRCL